jgi:hypothetical protein
MLRKKEYPNLVFIVESLISCPTGDGEMVARVLDHVKLNMKGYPKMFLRKKLDEVNLHQLVLDKMAEQKGTDAERYIMLCRIAHIYIFGSALDMASFRQDWLNYKLHGIVPNFVEKYLLQ